MRQSWQHFKKLHPISKILTFFLGLKNITEWPQFLMQFSYGNDNRFCKFSNFFENFENMPIHLISKVGADGILLLKVDTSPNGLKCHVFVSDSDANAS